MSAAKSAAGFLQYSHIKDHENQKLKSNVYTMYFVAIHEGKKWEKILVSSSTCQNTTNKVTNKYNKTNTFFLWSQTQCNYQYQDFEEVWHDVEVWFQFVDSNSVVKGEDKGK